VTLKKLKTTDVFSRIFGERLLTSELSCHTWDFQTNLNINQVSLRYCDVTKLLKIELWITSRATHRPTTIHSHWMYRLSIRFQSRKNDWRLETLGRPASFSQPDKIWTISEVSIRNLRGLLTLLALRVAGWQDQKQNTFAQHTHKHTPAYILAHTRKQCSDYFCFVLCYY